MCLAIFKPKGVTIKKRYLKNGWDANEDGAGFAVAMGKRVEIHKGFFTFKEFYSAFSKFNNARETAIVHFRFATHGACTKINCHPFGLAKDKYALIHNGVLDIECSNKALSDTAHFAELVLAPVLEAGVAFDSGALRWLIESAIGAGNKLVLLKGDGRHVIFNEGEGEWKNGAWYSNSGYKWAGWGMSAYGMGKGYGGSYATYSRGYGSQKREWNTHEEYNDWIAGSGNAGSVSAEGYGSEWEYKHDPETNQWKRSDVQKRLSEMSEEEWRREAEEELARANDSVLRDDDGKEISDVTENEKYSG